METRLSHLMIFNLKYFELAPFYYFLNLSFVPPTKVKDVYPSEDGTINCILSIPTNIDPDMLEDIWHDWKTKDLDFEYALQN